MTRPRRAGDMTQKQMVGAIAATAIAALIVGAGSQIIQARDLSISNQQIISTNSALIPAFRAELSLLRQEITDLKQHQGLSDLELEYSRNDRETQSKLVQQNVEVLNRVDKTLVTFEVKITGELDSLKKEVTALDERLDKAGL